MGFDENYQWPIHVDRLSPREAAQTDVFLDDRKVGYVVAADPEEGRLLRYVRAPEGHAVVWVKEIVRGKVRIERRS